MTGAHASLTASDIVEFKTRTSGFDTRALKEIVKQRRADPAKLSELQEIVELYKDALR